MGVGLAERGFSGGNVVAGRIDRCLVGLKAGDGVVLRLLAHDALLGKRYGAVGVGFLVVEVGLSLHQRCLRRIHQGFGVYNYIFALAALAIMLAVYGAGTLALDRKIGFS